MNQLESASHQADFGDVKRSVWSEAWIEKICYRPQRLTYLSRQPHTRIMAEPTIRTSLDIPKPLHRRLTLETPISPFSRQKTF